MGPPGTLLGKRDKAGETRFSGAVPGMLGKVPGMAGGSSNCAGFCAWSAAEGAASSKAAPKGSKERWKCTAGLS